MTKLHSTVQEWAKERIGIKRQIRSLTKSKDLMYIVNELDLSTDQLRAILKLLEEVEGLEGF